MYRELNELERLSIAVGQPFNVVVMFKIKGKITKKDLEYSFNKLQQKHPLLNVRIIFNEKEKPYFTSEEVGKVPIEERPLKEKNQSIQAFHKQLTKPFNINDVNLPLIRVKLLTNKGNSIIIICAYHAITDGFSMVYLARDLVNFMINPELEIKPELLPKKDIDLFTPKVRRMIPKKPFYGYMVYIFLRIYNFLRYLFSSKRKTARINVKEEELEIYTFNLTEEQTNNFLKRCKKEQVSVHSAVSTAFVQEYPIIGSPINLRNRLNHNVGEGFAFYSSVVVYGKKYKKKLSFWQNARKIQRNLSQNLRDRKLFVLQKIFSKAIDIKLMRKIGTYYIEIVTKKEPFALDNLGPLDKFMEQIDFEKFPPLEAFYGGITSFLNTFIVLLYTLQKKMHFNFHYTVNKYNYKEMEKYAGKIKERLLNAINL